MKDILETLKEDGSFQTLLSTLNMTDLGEKLKQPGPFTLFAPNDEAFKRVDFEEITRDKDNLRNLLRYHLLTGTMMADQIKDHESLYTECGKSLTVHLEEGLPVIDNGKYVKTDIKCANGVIHIIDNVFLPQFSGWYCGCC
jgi:uncharacterized surface protein with fasciclin (FAS1) repeats